MEDLKRLTFQGAQFSNHIWHARLNMDNTKKHIQRGIWPPEMVLNFIAFMIWYMTQKWKEYFKGMDIYIYGYLIWCVVHVHIYAIYICIWVYVKHHSKSNALSVRNPKALSRREPQWRGELEAMNSDKVHPRKINGWNLRIHPLEEVIVQTIIFRFYVHLRGWKKWQRHGFCSKLSRQETPNSVKTKCNVCVTTLCVSTLCVSTLCVSTLCVTTLCEHFMCDHSMWALYVWALYVWARCVSTLCVNTLCEQFMCDHFETTLCEHSMWDHSMCDHSMWALYVRPVCVTTLCEHPMCDHSVWALYETTLCETTLCKTTLCVTTLYVSMWAL